MEQQQNWHHCADQGSKSVAFCRMHLSMIRCVKMSWEYYYWDKWLCEGRVFRFCGNLRKFSIAGTDSMWTLMDSMWLRGKWELNLSSFSEKETLVKLWEFPIESHSPHFHRAINLTEEAICVCVVLGFPTLWGPNVSTSIVIPVNFDPVGTFFGPQLINHIEWSFLKI